MNKEEEKKKPKQWKVGITEIGWNRLSEFLDLINKNSKRKVRIPDILEHAVQKLTEKDIRKIQELVYTPDDKIEIMLEEYNHRNLEKPLSRDQLKVAMIELYEKQVLCKIPKVSQNEKQEILRSTETS